MPYCPKCGEKVSREGIWCSDCTDAKGSAKSSFTMELFEIQGQGELVDCARCDARGYLWGADKEANLIDKFFGMAITKNTCPVCSGVGKIRV